jgi:signal transduction histidine kinase/CheY-like chemotaxis protein
MTELVEQLPVTVWQFRAHPNGPRQFLYVGQRAAVDRGVAAEDLLLDGKLLFANVLQEDQDLLQSASDRAEQGVDAFHCEYRVNMPGGGIKWVRSAATLRPQPDGAVLWTGYWSDISAQKAMQRALQDATDEANRANRAKSTFLATMSHEIRTPMNGVLGLLELLSLSGLDSEQRATLGVISESGRALLRIIDDILDFSKVEAGRLALNPVPSSIHEVVSRACQIHSGIASSRGLLLQKSVDPRVSPALVFDPLRLGQVLNNLISNALKFTVEGGVTLSVESVSRTEQDEKLRFTIVDTGIGLSPAAAATLFEPFAQADSGTAARFGGTGLGLAICKRLTEMMGGSVTLASEEGQGTRVTLEVTFALASEAELRAAEAADEPHRQLSRTVATRRPAPGVADAEAEGRLLLVVDDHPTNRLVLSRQVAALGYGLLMAEDGVQALELWRQRRIGLVLTDCNMPELSGYGLAQAIRADESQQARSRTPIIACTANALGDEAARCLAAGMDDFLAKPVNLLELMGRLDQWLPLPPAKEPAQAAADADVLVDSETLEAITGGNASVLREMLLDFRQVNDADVDALKDQLRKGDLEQVLHMTHRIKGAARTIGAHCLTLSCEALEQATRSGGQQEALEELGLLEREVTRLNLHIDQLTTSAAAGNPPGGDRQ